MEITAKMVNDLREKTGAGMMDCKKALVEVGGDVEKAVDALRKAGIAKAEKKADRATKDGRIAMAIQGGAAAMVEVHCETDFVSKNETFQAFVKGLVAKVLAMSGDGDVTEALQQATKAELQGLIATIGENMQLRRAIRWTTPGQFACYDHQNLGKQCVLIDVEGEADAALCADICMHIAAFKPNYVVATEIPAEIIAKEREIAAAQITGKPANMIENIVNGKINKWFTEVCLVKQPWMRDDKTCLEKVAPKLQVRRFVRWQLGG